MKDQFLDASPESLSAKDVLLNADLLANISTNKKEKKKEMSVVSNKHSSEVKSSIDSSSKPSNNRIRNELRIVKGSIGQKQQTLPRQKPTGRGFLQSSASIVQTSIKNKSQSSSIPRAAAAAHQKTPRPPSSSIPITSKSHTQSSSTMSSSIRRPLSTPVKTPIMRIGTSFLPSSSSECRKLNPIDLAKTLRMELAQWQRKRLGQRNETSEKVVTPPPPPATTTTTTTSSVDSPTQTAQTSSPSSGDDIIGGNTTSEHVPQTEDNQMYTEASDSVEPIVNNSTNQLLVDLTLNSTAKHPPLSYSVDMDASDSPILISSSDENELVSKQSPEMINIPIQSLASEVKVSSEANAQLLDKKKVKTVDDNSAGAKSTDNSDCIKATSNTFSSHLPPKPPKENNSAFCPSDRHKRALVNRSRVKEYDRIRRERIMKRRL